MPLNGGGTASKPPGTTAVPNTTISSAPFNSVIDDIYAIFNTPRPIAYGGTDGTDIASAQTNLNVVGYSAQTLTETQKQQARTNIGAVNATAGDLYGLTLSNNATDATNDIDIAAGFAASNGAVPFSMQLSSTLTKRLDASWAVGTGNGGLDTGSIANGTYHVYLMQRSDTGVVDACFSASAAAPTTGGAIPVAYDRFRRIGSVLRESASLVSFRQFGDIFQRVAVSSVNSTGGFVSALVALNIPTGIVVQPLLSSLLTVNASSSVQFSLGSAWLGVVNEIWHNVVSDAGGPASDAQILSGGIFSNTSGQVYMARAITTGSAAAHSINTNGWIDLRGRT